MYVNIIRGSFPLRQQNVLIFIAATAIRKLLFRVLTTEEDELSASSSLMAMLDDWKFTANRVHSANVMLRSRTMFRRYLTRCKISSVDRLYIHNYAIYSINVIIPSPLTIHTRTTRNTRKTAKFSTFFAIQKKKKKCQFQ